MIEETTKTSTFIKCQSMLSRTDAILERLKEYSFAYESTDLGVLPEVQSF